LTLQGEGNEIVVSFVRIIKDLASDVNE
jgi:hypothetical protein